MLKVLGAVFRDVPLSLAQQLEIVRAVHERLFDVSFLVRKRALSTLAAVMFHFKEQLGETVPAAESA